MRYATINLISMILIVVFLLGIAGFCTYQSKSMLNATHEISQDISDARSDGAIDDVEGYGIIAKSSFLFFSGLVSFVMIIFFVILPIFLALIILALCITAQIALRKSPEGLTIYRVTMGINYALLLVTFFFVFSAILENFILIPFIICLCFLVFLIGNMFITYSSLITRKSADK